MPSTLLTTRQACEFLGVCRKTLWRMWRRKELRRTQSRGCRGVIRWPLAELERFVANNTRECRD
jgi:excisionase family DNA binding protein